MLCTISQFRLQPRWRLVIGLAALLGLSEPDAVAQISGSFVLTGSLTTDRLSHTATLLHDGRVLIAGGFRYQGREYLASAELYDPAMGTFSPTGAMINPRAWHTATLLSDGRVLIAGGYNSAANGGGYTTASAEIYDPATGTFAATGDMVTPQRGHSASLLENGKVFLSGSGFAAQPEIYDPLSGTFAPVGDVDGIGSGTTATRLLDGTVLTTGGHPANAVIYDPASGVAHLIAPIPTPSSSPYYSRESSGLDYQSSTLLANGQVLIAGGAIDGYGEVAIQQAYLYDPGTQSIQPAGSLASARDSHTATLLPDGRVLIAGGFQGVGTGSEVGIRQDAELYDPATGTVTGFALMNKPRDGHTATLLPNGRVLIVGGRDVYVAELYLP